ncbi:hypothetical protein DFH27DRAFT_226782 [Peziza echinospora]|nr:hypothetical protein DFH27DRAFT_226782 [Peziza echinospora]
MMLSTAVVLVGVVGDTRRASRFVSPGGRGLGDWRRGGTVWSMGGCAAGRDVSPAVRASERACGGGRRRFDALRCYWPCGALWSSKQALSQKKQYRDAGLAIVWRKCEAVRGGRELRISASPSYSYGRLSAADGWWPVSGSVGGRPAWEGAVRGVQLCFLSDRT